MIGGMNPRGRGPGDIARIGGRNAANSKESPGAVSRFLYSCGYEVVGRVQKAGLWMRAEVKDRKTGEPKGYRWVRPRAAGPGYEVRSADPDPKVRNLDDRRRCSCGQPLVTLALGEEVPSDICSQQVGDALGGVLCITLVQSMEDPAK
jgi:hypothetical protein